MRKNLLFLIVIGVGLIFIGRLFYLQIYESNYATLSDNNAIKVVYDYPQRGYVYDRNGLLMVANQPSYDVMVIPKDTKPLDTLEFCQLLNIEPIEFNKAMGRARRYSPRLPSVVVGQLTKGEFAGLSEKLHKYPGFYIQKRSLRDYQVDHSANVLGYISEVNDYTIKENPEYEMGELIGTAGIEKQYEEVLRGTKGTKYIQKDNYNRDIGPYKDGQFDVLPQRGQDITLTIDAALQAYGESLMVNKRGGIVALEPQTGEILSLVAAPNYDPALLVGRQRSKNFTKLYYDTIAKPLFDRVLQGEYPPGSPFKTLTALIGLEEEVINTKEHISCYGSYNYGGAKPMGCHEHKTPLSMTSGIAYSCNSYFATVYRRTIDKYETPQEGIERWRQHLRSFGLGDYLGYDLPAGNKGLIPDAEFYNRYYQYPKYKWYTPATISNAIGQGEVLLTPMQMVHFTSVIANRGHFYKPHIIKKIEGGTTIPEQYTIRHNTTIDPKHFEPVIQGMAEVYQYGTAASPDIGIKGIEICGKTGTAENYMRIDGERVQLTDHSVFIAFAPKDDPKISIAVFVENGYWGSRWAGRIAGLMIEQYLTGTITRKDMEAYVLNGSLMNEYEKPYTGQPFKINQ
ncbi:MAG: penicillin-binding protein 2 [Flavobacteriaceae bacterium]|nr:penicillin-binding protein 2 [Flavobacteriaceae bacterium]